MFSLSRPPFDPAPAPVAARGGAGRRESNADVISALDFVSASMNPLNPLDMALSPSSAVCASAKTRPATALAALVGAPWQLLWQMLRALFSLQRESAGARLLARGVLATWLLPLFFALVASFMAPPARAQVAVVGPAGGTPAQTVVVLDFAVSPGLDPLYGRKAADGLAVELQRSGEYDVVPRQRVTQAVNDQPGLQPPFNNTAQIQLAAAVNASSVFSGRVVGINTTQGRSARVTVEVRQLDVITGDYINGTTTSEPAEQKLGNVPTEALVDEAINKAVFAAVRSMRETTLPTGVVLNTATDTVELSIGTNRGVLPGQRYTVLRDQNVPGRNVVERRKIAEVKIVRVDRDQATATISAGGQQGVMTGDRVRQIYEARNYPVSSDARGTSSTPVTAPPVRRQNGGGFANKTLGGLVGIGALALLVGFAGLGGNDSGSNPPRTGGITEATPAQVLPKPVFSFDAGFNGVNLAQTLDRESVVAYLVYRGTAPNFTPDVANLQFVIDARFDPSNKRIQFVDNGVTGTSPSRLITFTSTTSTQTGGITTTGNATVNVSVTDADVLAANTIQTSQNALAIQFTQRPLVIGTTYYYRVGRITAVRTRTNVAGNANGNNNNGGSTSVTIQPVRSPVSDSTGGYTPLFLPQITGTSGNTDNFTVTINTDFTQFANIGSGQTVVDANGNVIITGLGDTFGYATPPNFNVGSGVNQFRFLVSTTPSFTPSATFVSPDISNPGVAVQGGSITLDLGNASNIRIPSTQTNPYIPGVTPLFVRVLSRNTNDANPTFRVSPTFTVQNATGLDRKLAQSSTFLPNSGGPGQGVNLPGGGGLLNRRANGSSGAPRVGAPR